MLHSASATTTTITILTLSCYCRICCRQVLGQGAVHGAFAAYTGFTVGLVNTHYVYLPIPTIIQAPRRVNPKGRRWNRCGCCSVRGGQG